MPLRLAVLLATAAALVAAAVWMTAPPRGGPTIAAILREPERIGKGTPVYFHGVPVGAVDRIDRSDTGAVVTIRLRRADLRLRAGDRVAHGRTGATGAGSIVIVPSDVASRPWRPGDVLQPAAAP
jgi:ABC-type transporter Mla subunit MlaD